MLQGTKIHYMILVFEVDKYCGEIDEEPLS